MSQTPMAHALKRARKGVADPHAGLAAGTTGSVILPARSLGGSLAQIWDDLAARSSEPNAFACRWFMEPSLDHAGQGCELLLAMHRGRGIGMFPLMHRNVYGKIPAPHIRDFAHPNMFLSPVMLAEGHEELAWGAVLGTLAERGEHYALFGPFDADGPVARSLRAVAGQRGYAVRAVKPERRALFCSDLTPDQYWERAVRGKKRKELRRQERRLSELGVLGFNRLSKADDTTTWTRDFLSLESAGWKGAKGSALDASESTVGLFRAVVGQARDAGSLQMCRLTLDGRPIAMLATLTHGKGGFSFKTAYDESLSAYSPGVLLQYHNLDLPRRAGLDWIDSCAAPGHPMIDSLWTERRSLARYAVSFKGGWSRRAFDLVHRAKEWKRGRIAQGEDRAEGAA